jgi:hypothetical protein
MSLPPEVKDWTLRETCHYNGGSAWFGYEHTCVQHPRLTRFMRCDKKTRTCATTWRVAGTDQPDLATAVQVLGACQ